MVPPLSRRIFLTSRFHRFFCTLRSSSISTEELIAARKQSDKELIMRVDEYNNGIGAVTREQMRANNFMHRASYILIFDELDRLYVQKRVHTKDYCPSHFDVCTGGVVDANEQNKDNAIRELKEEMGIDLKDLDNDKKLKFHGTFFYESPNQSSSVWMNLYSLKWNEKQIKFQQTEIESVAIKSIDEIIKEYKDDIPYCPDSINALFHYLVTQKQTKNFL